MSFSSLLTVSESSVTVWASDVLLFLSVDNSPVYKNIKNIWEILFTSTYPILSLDNIKFIDKGKHDNLGELGKYYICVTRLQKN